MAARLMADRMIIQGLPALYAPDDVFLITDINRRYNEVYYCALVR